MSYVVFGQFVLLVFLTLLSSEQKQKLVVFLHCSIFTMPWIRNNLLERAIGMLDACMSTEHAARHVGYSSRVSRNLCVRFRTTGSTNNLQRRGRPRVTKSDKDSYIMNTHLSNRFQTATATAANTPGLHNNRISMQTVHNRLQESGLLTCTTSLLWMRFKATSSLKSS